MSRGDQRDRDRAENQKKQQAKIKAQGKGGNPLQRNLSDAAALEAKVAAKKAQQAVLQPSDTPTAPVRKKVVTHKKDSVDDLLSTGLTTIKQRVK